VLESYATSQPWSRPQPPEITEQALQLLRKAFGGRPLTEEESKSPALIAVEKLPESKLHSFGDHVHVGLNAVTKLLERRQADFVVVAVMNQTSSILARHLATLACLSNTPLLQLSTSSAALGRCCGLRTAIAIGFKSVASNAELSELIAALSALVPSPLAPQIPWLQPLTAVLNATTEADDETDTEPHARRPPPPGSNRRRSVRAVLTKYPYAPLSVTQGHAFTKPGRKPRYNSSDGAAAAGASSTLSGSNKS